MDGEYIVKGAQGQATAKWIEYLNQARLDKFMNAWNKQDQNKAEAMKELNEGLNIIKEEIIERNRGGDKGMHGFIAEVAECKITNARQLIIGKKRTDKWPNDNGPVDIYRNKQPLQVKFYEKNFSLDGVKKHMDAYPEVIINEHGKFVIPQDQYEEIKRYLSMPKAEAGKLTNPAYRDWKNVQKFFSEGDISLDDFEPSVVGYKDVQANQIDDTIAREKRNLKETDREERNRIREESKPTTADTAKTVAAAAVFEGGTTFVMVLIEKRKSGKRFRDFDQNDWLEIAKKTGVSFGEGALRSFCLQKLAQVSPIPPRVASSMLTASFGIAEQAYMLKTGQISETEFIENAEILSIEVAVCLLSSVAGMALKHVPMFGPMLENTIGTFLYQVAMDLPQIEKDIVASYLDEIAQLNAQLDAEQQEFIREMNENLVCYMDLLENAFTPDPESALVGSVELAVEVGVPTEEILDTQEKITSYFMD